MNHVFGPVPSRRLGRSLGVDLVPFKTCPYDCIYCQLGRTTCKTLERRRWVPVSDVLEEIKGKIAAQPDYITLSGSGEPTLCADLGAIIEGIHSITDIPVAVLTNSSLLWQPEVRREITGANLIVPSLDAGNALMFSAVNRPHADLSFERMLAGLIALREEYAGALWLEVFILSGYTADRAEMSAIVEHANRVKPDRIQLNTVTRPPAEEFAMAVERARLEELSRCFSPEAEVIADFREVHQQRDFSATREAVMSLLERRPCSLDDIASGLGIHRNEAVKHIEELLGENRIEGVRSLSSLYYRPAPAGTTRQGEES